MAKRLLFAVSVAIVAAGCGSSSETASTPPAASTTAPAATPGKTMGGGPKGMGGIRGTAAANNADARFGSAGK